MGFLKSFLKSQGRVPRTSEMNLLKGGDPKMEFEIGQIFEGEYPPEAAFWCNDCGDRYIKEVEATLDGVPRFQIVKVPDLTDEEIAAHVRAERDMKIAETDYLAMPDYPLSDGERVQVFAYRQALRDVPTQEGFPREVAWPDVPAVFKRTKG